MDVGDAYRNVRKGKVLSVYVLAGDSAFLRREMQYFLRNELVNEATGGSDCERIDVENSAQVATALDLVGMPTFSGGRRVIIISGGDVFGGKKVDPVVSDAVCAYLESPAADSTVIFDAPIVDNRRKTTALARKRGFVVDCIVPKGRDLIRWVQRRAGLRGKKIGPDVAIEVIDRSGANMDIIVGEIDKLADYTGDRQHIGMGDVKTVVPASAQATAFSLVDAVLDRRPGAALDILQSLWLDNEAPVRLLALLHSQLRVLVMVRAMQIRGMNSKDIERSGIAHPFVVRKCLTRTSVDISKLAEAIVRLHEADVKIKTGRLDARLAVELLVYELSSLPADH